MQKCIPARVRFKDKGAIIP